MDKKHWPPSGDAEFDDYYKQYCQKVSANTTGSSPVWTHIPAARVTELTNGYAAWYTAYSRLKQAHTSADVKAKNDAKDAGVKLLQDFNNQYILYAREVTGAHVHDKTRTTVPTPQDRPTAGTAYSGPESIELENIHSLPGGTDDPRADFGTRIFWGVLGEATAADKFRLSAIPLTGEDRPKAKLLGLGVCAMRKLHALVRGVLPGAKLRAVRHGRTAVHPQEEVPLQLPRRLGETGLLLPPLRKRKGRQRRRRPVWAAV